MTTSTLNTSNRVLQRERLFVSLRFVVLLLLGAFFVLAPNKTLSVPVAVALYVVAACMVLNSGAWLLLRSRRFADWIAMLGGLADVLFLLFSITISGGAGSALWPLVLFLIAAAAWRYGMLGGSATAITFAAIVVLYALRGGSDSAALLAPGVNAIMFLTVALMLGWGIHFERVQALQENEHALQALQSSQHDIKAFAEMTGTIAGTTNYQVALQQLLDLNMRGLRTRGQTVDATAGVILLFDFDDVKTLVVAAQRQFEPLEEGMRLTSVEGAIKAVLKTPDPLVLKDARHDPLLGKFATVQKFPCVAIVPLRVGLKLFGVVVFAGSETLPDIFSQRLELMEVYATQAAIAVQNAQMMSQLEADRDAIIDGEEKVRHELARDLHDGPVNQVASLAMGLDFVLRLLEKEPGKAREEISSLHKMATKTARDMRLTMYRLRPLALETSGLGAALDQYISRLRTERSRPAFHFSAPEAATFEPRLSSNAATMVFDIMKEAISNSLKHADAANLWVDLRTNSKWLTATTRDDGKGFDVAAVQANYSARGSLGMINIQERAELAEGEATIESAPGKGTTVSVRVPLKS